MQTVWAAKKNADLTEGRGPMVIIALFSDEVSARSAARGWGVMGVGDGEVTPMFVYNTYREYVEEKDNEIRNRALAKLSEEEKRTLGL